MEVEGIAILGCIVAFAFGLTAIFSGTNEEPEAENSGVEENVTWSTID